jgi:hypothetical protein
MSGNGTPEEMQAIWAQPHIQAEIQAIIADTNEDNMLV